MKRGHIYTLVFMVLITVVLVFALAAAYEGFKPAIASNKELQQQRDVLYVFGLGEGLEGSEVTETYTAKIQKAPLGNVEEAYGLPVLAHVEGGEPLAYAVPFEGAGLWGTIKGYLGVKADLSETTGIVFTAQNETPGLGGRIDEPEFKEKFRGVALAVEEGKAKDLVYGSGLDAVTGATQTSQAVLRMVNQTIKDNVFTEGVQ